MPLPIVGLYPAGGPLGAPDSVTPPESPDLATLLSPLGETIEAEVLDVIRSILKSDPFLTANASYPSMDGSVSVRPVTLWLGEDDPTQDDNPGPDQIPAIRMEIGKYPTFRRYEKAQAGTLDLQFHCYVPGRHFNDCMLLCNALENALFPQLDPTRGAYVKAQFWDKTFTNGRLTNGFFANSGGAPVIQGKTRYATRILMTLTLNIEKFRV